MVCPPSKKVRLIFDDMSRNKLVSLLSKLTLDLELLISSADLAVAILEYDTDELELCQRHLGYETTKHLSRILVLFAAQLNPDSVHPIAYKRLVSLLTQEVSRNLLHEYFLHQDSFESTAWDAIQNLQLFDHTYFLAINKHISSKCCEHLKTCIRSLLDQTNTPLNLKDNLDFRAIVSMLSLLSYFPRESLVSSLVQGKVVPELCTLIITLMNLRPEDGSDINPLFASLVDHMAQLVYDVSTGHGTPTGLPLPEVLLNAGILSQRVSTQRLLLRWILNALHSYQNVSKSTISIKSKASSIQRNGNPRLVRKKPKAGSGEALQNPLRLVCDDGTLYIVSHLLLHCHHTVRVEALQVLSQCVVIAEADGGECRDLFARALLERHVVSVLEGVRHGFRNTSNTELWPETSVRNGAASILSSVASHISSSEFCFSLTKRAYYECAVNNFTILILT